jgi:hypothetical protein
MSDGDPLDTPELIRSVAASWWTDSVDQPWLTLTKIRTDDWRFAPSWLSSVSWDLPEHLAEEVGLARQRTAELDTIRSVVLEKFPDIVDVKGGELAQRYAPAARFSRDLDLVARDEETMWEVAEFLVRDLGLAQHALLRVPTSTGPRGLLASFVAAADSPWQPALHVDLGTLLSPGRGGRVPPLTLKMLGESCDRTSIQLLAVAASRLTRSFRPRDLVDACVLVREMADEACHGVVEQACRAGLDGYLAELFDLVDRHVADDVVPRALIGRRAPRRRFIRGALKLARDPVGAALSSLQYSAVVVRRPTADRFWRTAVARRAAIRRVDSLWGFGLPVRDESGDTSKPVASTRVLRSAGGTFYLALDGEIDEDELGALELVPA